MAFGTALVPETKNRWLLVSFVVTLLLLLVLLWNLVQTQQTLAHLEETHLRLEHAASELPLHIQGMQASVRIATESGDLNWRRQHQEHRQGVARTLKRIRQIESRSAVTETVARLRKHLEKADTFYQRVFERLVRGEKEAAKSVLGSWPYIRNRNALREQSEQVSRLLREDVRQRLAEQQQLVTGTVVAVLLLSLVMLLSWILSLRNWNLNVRQRQEKEAEILYLSYHDELTGLPNRRRFFEVGEMEIARTNRYGHPISILIVDIDHFKWVNDTFGHLVGDQVLKSISEALRPELRDGDLLARLGGEEFGVVLPETALRPGFQVAERLRQRAADMDATCDGQMIAITVSIGLTSTDLGESGLDTLLSVADDALYRAKESGRNRVVSKTLGSPVGATTWPYRESDSI